MPIDVISIEDLLPVLSGFKVLVQYILECNDILSGSNTPKVCPFLFSINSSSVFSDPRLVPFNSLLQATGSRLVIPKGYSFVHNFIVSVSKTNSDSEGWQYGTTCNDSNWDSNLSNEKCLKRRLWFRLITQTEKLELLKNFMWNYFKYNTNNNKTFTDYLLINVNSNAAHKTKNWIRKLASITENGIKLISSENRSDDHHVFLFSANTRITEEEENTEAPEDPRYLFSITDSRNNNSYFGCDNECAMSKWMFQLSYSLAIQSTNFDFHPFQNGPPFSKNESDVIFFSGELYKLDFSGKCWKLRYFELTMFQLRYFRGCELRGTIDIPGAILKQNDEVVDNKGIFSKVRNLIFSVVACEGFSMTFRASSQEEKTRWIKELKTRIDSWPVDVDMGLLHGGENALPVFSLSETFDTFPCDDDVTITTPYHTVMPLSHNKLAEEKPQEPTTRPSGRTSFIAWGKPNLLVDASSSVTPLSSSSSSSTPNSRRPSKMDEAIAFIESQSASKKDLFEDNEDDDSGGEITSSSEDEDEVEEEIEIEEEEGGGENADTGSETSGPTTEVKTNKFDASFESTMLSQSSAKDLPSLVTSNAICSSESSTIIKTAENVNIQLLPVPVFNTSVNASQKSTISESEEEDAHLLQPSNSEEDKILIDFIDHVYYICIYLSFFFTVCLLITTLLLSI